MFSGRTLLVWCGRNVRVLRDQFVTIGLGRILYHGHFFTPEREFLTSTIPASQRTVNGVVRLKLLKGNVVVEGRHSEEGLYDEQQSSMNELSGFEPTDDRLHPNREHPHQKMGPGERAQGPSRHRAQRRLRRARLIEQPNAMHIMYYIP
ncbi:hypothetical protein OG21DRAFT_203960 [Imleria badia]|nr:hypothetical protein OG21DRAFT_203960 [Imleria badia]